MQNWAGLRFHIFLFVIPESFCRGSGYFKIGPRLNLSGAIRRCIVALELFSKFLKQEGLKGRANDVLLRWLHISKRIGKNPLGEWGRVESPHVRIKNTRDFAFLTLKRHGSPMHFVEVAKGIEKLFSREAHPATTHNELIKDARFVLVGRGLYALKEWGYEPGVVRDVIKGIIERDGALLREEIIDRVKRERYVKDATIAVNLQNPMFVRLSDGRYSLSK